MRYTWITLNLLFVLLSTQNCKSLSEGSPTKPSASVRTPADDELDKAADNFAALARAFKPYTKRYPLGDSPHGSLRLLDQATSITSEDMRQFVRTKAFDELLAEALENQKELATSQELHLAADELPKVGEEVKDIYKKTQAFMANNPAQVGVYLLFGVAAVNILGDSAAYLSGVGATSAKQRNFFLAALAFNVLTIAVASMDLRCLKACTKEGKNNWDTITTLMKIAQGAFGLAMAGMLLKATYMRVFPKHAAKSLGYDDEGLAKLNAQESELREKISQSPNPLTQDLHKSASEAQKFADIKAKIAERTPLNQEMKSNLEDLEALKNWFRTAKSRVKTQGSGLKMIALSIVTGVIPITAGYAGIEDLKGGITEASQKFALTGDPSDPNPEDVTTPVILMIALGNQAQAIASIKGQML